MFMVEVTLPGGTQFASATPIVTFQEWQSGTVPGAPPPTMPADQAPRILGWSYASLGAAHTASMWLAPAAAAAVNEQIAIPAMASAANSFSRLCGTEGIVVPRRFGFSSVAQPPAGPYVQIGTPFQVFLETVGKDNAATFRLWYALGGGT